MSSVIATIERAQLRRVPSFAPGDRVKVHFQVIEGARTRVQVFEGVVIKRQGHGARETFTVRKQSFGIGVERTFPVHSPKIERVELAARGEVRRAKLYYLRGRVGKRARVRERRYSGPEAAIEPGLVEDAGADGLEHEVPAQEAQEAQGVDGGVAEQDGLQEAPTAPANEQPEQDAEPAAAADVAEQEGEPAEVADAPEHEEEPAGVADAEASGGDPGEHSGGPSASAGADPLAGTGEDDAGAGDEPA